MNRVLNMYPGHPAFRQPWSTLPFGSLYPASYHHLAYPSIMKPASHKLAFAAVATATTAGLWFLWPYAHTSVFRTKHTTISSPHSLALVCSSDADYETDDALFVIHTTADNYNSTYLPFEPETSLDLPPIEHTDSLPLSCLDAFFSKGVRCDAWRSHPVRFDVVWTWVNGTDPLHQHVSAEAEMEYFPPEQRPNCQTPKELKQFRYVEPRAHFLAQQH